MTIRFGNSGGQFFFSKGSSVAGIWASSTASLTSSAPAGRATTYAHQGQNFRQTTPNLGGNFPGIVAGYALFTPTISGSETLMQFYDSVGNLQCQLFTNASGQLLFRNSSGAQIGGTSTGALVNLAWSYIEAKVAFSNSGSGTCEARVNGVVYLTAGSLTNAQNANGCAQVVFASPNNAPASYGMDFYVLDTGTGVNTGYLGDITVAELFDNGVGVNSAWTPNVGPFSITSVANASGGNTVYTGTITGGTGNAYVGYNFVESTFAHGANNGTFTCIASTGTTLTLNNPSGVADTTGSAAFQAILQPGINQTGTRPNDDATYISSSTTNQISDFAHVPLVLTGAIFGVIHQTYARKDDSGLRQIAQVMLSSGTTETSATISLGSSYVYYQDIVENDPHTGAPFTLGGLNALTAGVKEIT